MDEASRSGSHNASRRRLALALLVAVVLAVVGVALVWTSVGRSPALADGPRTAERAAESDQSATSCTARTAASRSSDTDASSVLWSADHESGRLTDWSSNAGGGEYNSGRGDSRASSRHARSGDWSVRQAIDASAEGSGTRLFRWGESHEHRALYYSVWFYVPQRVSARDGWLNVFQFKSRDERRNEPFWVVGVQNRRSGAMYFDLFDWQRRITYRQRVKNVPVRRWTHLEAYYRIASDRSGRITLWQDGCLLFDRRRVRTAFRYCCNPEGNAWSVGWSVNAYGERLRPRSYYHYVDDAVVSSRRIG